MPAHWSKVFFDILANHVMDYAHARGDIGQRTAILGTCVEEIKNSPLLKEHQVELPADLQLVGDRGQSLSQITLTLPVGNQTAVPPQPAQGRSGRGGTRNTQQGRTNWEYADRRRSRDCC